MKNLLTAVILFLVSVLLFAQQPGTVRDDMLRYAEWDNNRNNVEKQESALKFVKHHNDEGTDWIVAKLTYKKYFLYVKDKSLTYYGGATENFYKKWIRSGVGICRTIDGPQTKFYYGNWKQDHEHGEGLYYVRGEKVLYGQWRHGTMIKNKTREATAEEEKTMMEQIDYLEMAISVAY